MEACAFCFLVPSSRSSMDFTFGAGTASTVRRVFFASFEEVTLRGLERCAVTLADSFDDGTRVDAFVDMQRNGGHFEGGVFFFASPDELWIEVRIVLVDLARGYWWTGLWCYQPDGGIVDTSFLFVVVLFDGSLV